MTTKLIDIDYYVDATSSVVSALLENRRLPPKSTVKVTLVESFSEHRQHGQNKKASLAVDQYSKIVMDGDCCMFKLLLNWLSKEVPGMELVAGTTVQLQPDDTTFIPKSLFS